MLQVWQTRFSRRKYFKIDESDAGQLKRCLTTLDLTALGIGSTLGMGIYVLAGQVAKTETGPAVNIAFLIAAIASVFAGLCYAEFGARVPKAGSAYVYSYVTVGELVAFIIGWNLLLEYAIGAASVAKGYSGYIDSLCNRSMENAFRSVVTINVSWLAEYVDFCSFTIVLLLTVVLIVGVKESSRFNNIFTLVNLLVVVFVIIAGITKSDVSNWQIDPQKVEHDPRYGPIGSGGFMPFGFTGLMRGAATCFFAFVGFDAIATAGEEVKNPQRAIPISLCLSLLFIFLSYFGISSVLTLMLPYYEQEDTAPFPYVFEKIGWQWAKWLVTVGALAGLSTSLLGSMFPLPRILYAMSNDGLIFRSLSKVHPKFQTPYIASSATGLLAATISAVFNLSELVDMLSIGTLQAYMLVACSVTILRYRPTEKDSDHRSVPVHRTYSTREIISHVLNTAGNTSPTPLTSRISTIMVVILMLSELVLAIVLVFLQDELFSGHVGVIIISCLMFAVVFIETIIINRQPQNTDNVHFKVPGVPFIPALSIFINIYLMLRLSAATWVRFGVWMSIGLAIYFFYGQFESTEEYHRRGLKAPNELDHFENMTDIALVSTDPEKHNHVGNGYISPKTNQPVQSNGHVTSGISEQDQNHL